MITESKNIESTYIPIKATISKNVICRYNRELAIQRS